MEIRGCPGLVYTSCRQETKPPNKIPQSLDYNMDSSETISLDKLFDNSRTLVNLYKVGLNRFWRATDRVLERVLSTHFQCVK